MIVSAGRVAGREVEDGKGLVVGWRSSWMVRVVMPGLVVSFGYHCRTPRLTCNEGQENCCYGKGLRNRK